MLTPEQKQELEQAMFDFCKRALSGDSFLSDTYMKDLHAICMDLLNRQD